MNQKSLKQIIFNKKMTIYFGSKEIFYTFGQDFSNKLNINQKN